MAFSSKHLTQGENIELEFRTHIKKIVGPILLILAMLIVVILAWVFLPDDLSGRTWIFLAIAVAAALVTIIWAIIPIWKWRNTVFVLTNRRLITRTGIMAKSGRDIPLYRINDVQYEKGVSDRILGCGTLLVSDASDQPQLRLDDIPHVESVQVKINELLFAHYGEGDNRGVEGGAPAGRGQAPRAQARPVDQQQYDAPQRDQYDQQGRGRYDQQPVADTRPQPSTPRDGAPYDQGYEQPRHDATPPRDDYGQTRPLPRQDDPPQRY